MGREYLYLVHESSYLTPVATPVVGTDSIYIRQDGSNSFTPRGNRIFWDIMHGGGVAIPALRGSDQVEVKGKIQTKAYASQLGWLLAWCATPINAGQTAPWTTTEPAGDLASVSLYHAIQRGDGTYRRRRYAGAKATGWKLTGSRDSKIWSLEIDVVASKMVGNALDSSADPTATEFPFPAETALPTDPYAFSHAAGNFTVGSLRTQFDNLSISVSNVVDARFWESPFVQVSRFLGRKSTLDAKLYLKPTPDDRSTYEAVTAEAVSLALNNGTHTTTINFNGRNYVDKVEDDLPVDKIYEYGLTLMNTLDAGAGADITVSWA